MDNSAYNLRPSHRRHKTGKNFNFAFILIIWLVLLLVLNFFLYFNKKRNEFKEKRKEIASLEKEITQLEEKKTRLEREIYYLNTDKGIEDIARKKLGLVKKNEIAVIILDEKNRKPQYNSADNKENKNKASNGKSKGFIDKILKFLHIIK